MFFFFFLYFTKRFVTRSRWFRSSSHGINTGLSRPRGGVIVLGARYFAEYPTAADIVQNTFFGRAPAVFEQRTVCTCGDFFFFVQLFVFAHLSATARPPLVRDRNKRQNNITLNKRRAGKGETKIVRFLRTLRDTTTTTTTRYRERHQASVNAIRFPACTLTPLHCVRVVGGNRMIILSRVDGSEGEIRKPSDRSVYVLCPVENTTIYRSKRLIISPYWKFEKHLFYIISRKEYYISCTNDTYFCQVPKYISFSIFLTISYVPNDINRVLKKATSESKKKIFKLCNSWYLARSLEQMPLLTRFGSAGRFLDCGARGS